MSYGDTSAYQVTAMKVKWLLGETSKKKKWVFKRLIFKLVYKAYVDPQWKREIFQIHNVDYMSNYFS